MSQDERDFKLDRKIKAKSSDHIYDLHHHDVDLINNHIYLFGIDYYIYGAGTEDTSEPGVEFVMANRFIKNINLCMRVNKDAPIVIHLKTNGGDWHEGMAIYDTIKSCPFPVTILNYTHARSMSSIITQAATKKVTMPHGVFMFHDGEMGIYGTQKQVESNIDFYRQTRETMIDIYTASMREKGVMKNDSERKRWLKNEMNKKEDVYLTADQAIEYGFFDEKFSGNWASLTQYTEKQLSR
jgi:ATP-dependent protease ClpP protease subunit